MLRLHPISANELRDPKHNLSLFHDDSLSTRVYLRIPGLGT